MRTASHRFFPLNVDSLRPLHIVRAIGHRAVLGILGLASILFLAACGGGGSGTLPFGTLISISPQPASVPTNGTVVFTATSAESSGPVTWSLYCSPGGSSGFGTFSSTTGTTVTYTAPSSPAIIYIGGCDGIAGGGDGEVGVQATLLNEANDFLFSNYARVSFPITAPTVTVGLFPVTATVVLGSTEQFNGWAVGNVNNALTWQVNGVTGGSAATGTISNAVTANYEGGLYTAPTVMPMTGDTVTITMISQADPTKTLTAIVTLQ